MLLRGWARGAGRPLWARPPSLEGRRGPEAWIPARPGCRAVAGAAEGARRAARARRSPLSLPGARPHLTSPQPGHFRENTATADAGFWRSNLGGRSTSPNDTHVPGSRDGWLSKNTLHNCLFHKWGKGHLAHKADLWFNEAGGARYKVIRS